MGACSLLGEGPDHRLSDDKCKIRNRRDHAFVPRALQVAPVPDSGGRILRVGEERQEQATLLLRGRRWGGFRIRWAMGQVD
jgi:hypothetical protein